jgi:hypothetical protein
MKILRHPLFMRTNPESELEQAIDRELRRLPEISAPGSLMPRVLQAIARRKQLPWWQRSYTFWPWPARLVFLSFSSGLAALMLYFTWGLSLGVTFSALANEAAEVMAALDITRDVVLALGSAAVTLARSAGSSLLWVLGGLATACYLTTLGLGTFAYRLASQRI